MMQLSSSTLPLHYLRHLLKILLLFHRERYLDEKNLSLLPSLPMIKDSVDHHPLRLDPVSVEALLHFSIFGVLVLSLSTFLLFTSEVP